jgi:hypothetical protein
LIAGLWGVTIALVIGAAIGLALARRRVSRRGAHFLIVLSCLGGACLLVRGVAVEVVLLTDAGGMASNVGEQETHMSLVLWNPWFFLGGLLFAATGIQSWCDLRLRGAGRAECCRREWTS